jgi:hypothetical protein
MEKKKNRALFCAVSCCRNIHTKNPHARQRREWQTKLMASSSELAPSPPLSSPRGDILDLLHREQKESCK